MSFGTFPCFDLLASSRALTCTFVAIAGLGSAAALVGVDAARDFFDRASTFCFSLVFVWLDVPFPDLCCPGSTEITGCVCRPPRVRAPPLPRADRRPRASQRSERSFPPPVAALGPPSGGGPRNGHSTGAACLTWLGDLEATAAARTERGCWGFGVDSFSARMLSGAASPPLCGLPPPSTRPCSSASPDSSQSTASSTFGSRQRQQLGILMMRSSPTPRLKGQEVGAAARERLRGGEAEPGQV